MIQRIKDKLSQLIGISFWDSIYKTLTYRDFFIAAFPFCMRIRLQKVRKAQQKKIEQLHNQDKCSVVFFLQTPSVWKYDALYRKLEASTEFEPIIVISPYNVHINYDKQECFRVMHQTEEFAQKMGYHYVSAYNWEKNRWRDIKKEYHPDIVFFTKPYKDTLPQYHIYNYGDALTLYLPYGFFGSRLFHNNFGLPFHSLLWKSMLETDLYIPYAKQYGKSHGDNVEIVGALGMENLMNPDYNAKDVWKQQAKKKKRIIWAPHHTIDYLFNSSNFLGYCDDMLRLAEKYHDQIQIAFKPHPVLKFKLINVWGIERTEEYYQRWTNLSNGQLEQGDYIDLFKTSDAMIHDSISFMAEYLYAQKPVLFQIRDEKVKEEFNSFGQMCLDQHYLAYSIEETEKFIREVVIAGKDPKKAEREQFYKQYLYPKDGIMPSEKIFNILKNALGV